MAFPPLLAAAIIIIDRVFDWSMDWAYLSGPFIGGSAVVLQGLVSLNAEFKMEWMSLQSLDNYLRRRNY